MKYYFTRAHASKDSCKFLSKKMSYYMIPGIWKAKTIKNEEFHNSVVRAISAVEVCLPIHLHSAMQIFV